MQGWGLTPSAQATALADLASKAGTLAALQAQRMGTQTLSVSNLTQRVRGLTFGAVHAVELAQVSHVHLVNTHQFEHGDCGLGKQLPSAELPLAAQLTVVDRLHVFD